MLNQQVRGMPLRDNKLDPGVSNESGPTATGVDDGQRGASQRSLVPLRVAMLYDMDACHGPTGVTRHALAQLERLARRPEVTLMLLTGRMTHPDGLAYW